MELEQTKDGLKPTENVTVTQNKSDIWRDFIDNSTLHGLRNSFVRGSVFLRIVWSLLVLAAFVYLIFSTIYSCKRYFEYQTTFKLSYNDSDSFMFPAVTICSQSTADEKKIFALDNHTDFHSYRLNISACAATTEVRAGRPCGHALLCACVSLNVLEGKRIPDCDESYQYKILEALNSSRVTFDLEEFYHTFSESWSDVLQWCTFGINQTNCTNREYFEQVLRENGICHTFNSHKNDDFQTTFPGAPGGLTITLESQIDRYYFPKYSEGFTVFINEQGGSLSSTGIFAGPGTLTSISLEKLKVFARYTKLQNRCRVQNES
jgi:hypothetical protein